VLAVKQRKIGPALVPPLMMAALLGYVGVLDQAHASASALAINGAIMLASLVVATAAHEAAHALVARGAGLRPTAIFLGRGRAVWRATWRDVELVLGAVPFTGLTLVTAPSLRLLRPRLMATYAAGPLANLALGVLAWALLRRDETVQLARSAAPLLSFAVVNATMVAASVLPEPPRKGVRPGSDGYNFFSIPFWRKSSLVAIVSAHRTWEASRLALRGRHADALAVVEQGLSEQPGHLSLRLLLADLLVLTGAWSEAAPHLRALITERALARETSVLGLLENNLAWADFMLLDPALLDEAEALSRQALERLPEHPAVHGTRGAILVARRGGDGAREHLLFAFARNSPQNKALNACCLAMLDAERGATPEAQQWLAEARTLDASCPLLARAEAALTAAR
jgi:tetratricopeptide (TPR) repeat protein